MRELDELQSAFDDGLRGGLLPAGLKARDPAELERRFNVYRNNVFASLGEALAARFPVILRLVGDDFFRQMARLYIEAERPRTAVLHEWGSGFPDFLSAFPALQDYPYMADVARIEYQRGVSFHSADHQPADPSLFGQADPAALVLVVHPSVAVLHLDQAGVSIWASNQPNALPEKIAHGPQIALILRDRSFNVPVTAISHADATMIGALREGRTLMDAAQLAQSDDPSHEAGRVLQNLMAAGAIINAEVSRCAQ